MEQEILEDIRASAIEIHRFLMKREKTLRDEFAIQLMPFYISTYVNEEEAIRLCWSAVDKVLKAREGKR